MNRGKNLDVYKRQMLLWAGTGVAMGNADARLKMIADMTTDTNRNAGFARAVEQIVFDQWEKE